MMKINQGVSGFKSFLADLQAEFQNRVAEAIQTQLEAEVASWLFRGRYEKRQSVSRQSQARCQRCRSRNANAFSRNGHRQRQLVTTFGVVTYGLPRVVCECGGSVSIPFSILQPYQRFWDDVTEQVERWATLGLSLRQMQDEIGETMQTRVGLRKLNTLVQDVRTPPDLQLSSVPPVGMLDAIWVTLLEDTPAVQTDQSGRQRVVKARHKVAVLVALGLYPQSGRWGILGWHIADEESQSAWEALLIRLEQRGVYRERGVELFIHDGGSGLRAALNLIYPHIPHQRCLFHKLRNLWTSIQAPTDLTREQRRHFKRELLQSVLPLLDLDNEDQARQLRHTLSETWQELQPQFVETLQRDWHETVAFFRVLKRFPNWQRTALRTTSLLERVNRILRRYFRLAGAFHSLSGLIACVARVFNPKRLI
ncbi:MAG: transposase [Chloroflexota bacterium]